MSGPLENCKGKAHMFALRRVMSSAEETAYVVPDLKEFLVVTKIGP